MEASCRERRSRNHSGNAVVPHCERRLHSAGASINPSPTVAPSRRGTTMSNGKTRIETDTFGPIEVDASRYWGAQAQRSLGNFKIGWEKQPKPVVRALGVVKRAAAETNMALGRLEPRIGEAII